MKVNTLSETNTKDSNKPSNKYTIRLYRNIGTMNFNDNKKFLLPNIVKNKLAFRLSMSSILGNEDELNRMKENLKFSFDIVVIIKCNDKFRNKKIKNLKERLDEIDLLKDIDYRKYSSEITTYILTDKSMVEDIISFFNQYKLNLAYEGIAEEILQDYQYNRKEYLRQLSLLKQVNDCF